MFAQKLLVHLNFYRIHLLVFTITPLVFSVVFWASNGSFHIRFIDALFVCYSAATGTGLVSIDLSSLTALQQAILVVLELTGNQAFVAWVVVLVRRRYFRQHLEHIVVAEAQRSMLRRDTMLSNGENSPDIYRLREILARRRQEPAETVFGRSNPNAPRYRPEMIRRLDTEPRRINPSGTRVDIYDNPEQHLRRRSAFAAQQPGMPRTAAVNIAEPVNSVPKSRPGFGGFPGIRDIVSRSLQRISPGLHRNIQRTVTMPRTQTLIPRTSILEGEGGEVSVNSPVTQVPYFSFQAVVGRNSRFYGLKEEDFVELGGVEYRTLNNLLWLVPLYSLSVVVFSIIAVAPYMYLPQWKANFNPPQQHRHISRLWFAFSRYSIFQILGAWANTGMSLVDQNLVPFQRAYLLILVCIFCVLAGNTAFPYSFRFTIWALMKCFPHDSQTRESLLFLLHHPRRCFINLFPSRQTWLLLAIVFAMNVTLWAGNLILNINNPVTDAVPIGDRIVLGLLEVSAVRSSGLSGVPASALAPAAQVLFVIFMYIAVYPIAMSVRVTNVYEERSLGIYEEEEETYISDDPSTQVSDENRVAVWGKYLLRHVRHQLSFDMWWIALSLWLLCIIERGNLTNTNNATWFNIFALLFEVVSAYGTVGLSLGVPYANYSLSGALHVPSKLVLSAVMLRGRHRGLPVALDRSVMLPREFHKKPQNGQQINDNEEQPVATLKETPQRQPEALQEAKESNEESGSSSRTENNPTAPDKERMDETPDS
ncbi:TrkH-domain-containing protein [Panus rudis PR-1116 ss-1]|nr:TrkH-domain-containing protein [Panus rudis PR-1116 ss-1]